MHMPGQIVISTKISDIDRDVRLVDRRRSRSTFESFIAKLTSEASRSIRLYSLPSNSLHYCSPLHTSTGRKYDEGGTEFNKTITRLYTKASLS
jgi:hypothetical protein